MQRIPIDQLIHHVDMPVCVKGFVEAIREHKERLFLVIRDRTGSVQVVAERGASGAESLEGLTRESAVVVQGRLTENAKVRLGGREILLRSLDVVGPAQTPMPLDVSSREQPGIEHRLDWRHLDLRRPEKRRLFEVQTIAERAMRRFWEAEGLLEIHTPKLMGTASESGAELFELGYFETTAYLAQSPQFYKQMAMAAGFEGVFEIGPVFRADPSFTTRHTTEFTSVDVEISWIDSHEEVMHFEERWMRAVLQEVVERTSGEVAVDVPSLPFPRIPHAEAVQIVRQRQPGWEPAASGDLDPAGERLLSRHVAEQLGHEFVFVTDYPATVRPFYHMRHPGTELTRSFDLLWKGIEITTGAQREHRVEVLQQQAVEKGLSLETLESYLGFFRYGCPPHGGFGFGLARMLMVLLDQGSVRETTLLPRTPNRLLP